MRFAMFLFVAFAASFAASRWAFRPDSSARSPAVRSADTSAVARTASDSPPEPVGADLAGRGGRDQIRDAIAGDDPLASAGKVLAWLESTTAETFRKLAQE